MSKTHELKTDPEVFQASFWGNRDYEIRFNDRGYQVGDRLILRETEFSGEEMKLGKHLRYTGLSMTRTICHVLTGYGLEDGWVILAVNSKENLAATNKELLSALEDVREFVAEVAKKSGLTYSDAESYLQQIDLAITNAKQRSEP